MRQPVRHQQGVEFGGFAIVEGEDEFSAIRAETLQRMRQARGKVPQIALLHVRNRWAPLLVYDRDAAVVVSHHRPFRLLVPMEFANAAHPEAHVHARDRSRDREIIPSDLAGPTAILNALGSKVEGGPELRHPVDISRWRIKKGRHVIGERRVLRPGVGERALIGDVHRAFGREVGIAERGCMRSGRGDNHSGCADTEKAATGKLIHWPNLHRLSMPQP